MLQNQTPYSKTIVISRSNIMDKTVLSVLLCCKKQNSTTYIQGASLHSTVQQSPSSYTGTHSSHTKFTAAKWQSSLLPSGVESSPLWHHWQYQQWEYCQEPQDAGSRAQVGCLDCRCQVLDSHIQHWERHPLVWTGIAEVERWWQYLLVVLSKHLPHVSLCKNWH